MDIASLRNRIPENFKELLRFAIVGGICTVVDSVVYFVCLPLLGTRPALVLGYCTGLVFNYIMTVLWTFKTKMNVQNLIGIVFVHLINLFIVRFSLMKVFEDLLLLEEVLSYCLTVVISVVFSFIMVRFIVKRKVSL